jgi:hypothetical protein
MFRENTFIATLFDLEMMPYEPPNSASQSSSAFMTRERTIQAYDTTQFLNICR